MTACPCGIVACLRCAVLVATVHVALLLIYHVSQQITPHRQVRVDEMQTSGIPSSNNVILTNDEYDRETYVETLTTKKAVSNDCMALRETLAIGPFYQSCKGNTDQRCIHFGSKYGGFHLPYPLCFLQPGDTYYGFGCGEDISFDVAFGGAYDVRLRLFDPTPRAISHVEAVMQALETRQIPSTPASSLHTADKYFHKGKVQEISGRVNAKTWFETIVKSKVKIHQFEFRPWGLSTVDGNMSFYERQSGVSHTLLNVDPTKSKQKMTGRKITITTHRLDTIMQKMGDDSVDVLKADIEGYELHFIPDLIVLLKSWPKQKWPRILMFDMDSLRPGHTAENPDAAEHCINSLQQIGYSVFTTDSFDYTFVLDYKA